MLRIPSLLCAALVASLATSSVTAQNTAKISFIHAIPGLSQPVDVFVGSTKLFSFDFDESKGPIDIAAGNYTFDVKLGSTTVLSASPTLKAGENYTAIAHLKVGSGIQLSLFTNDLSAPAGADDARVAVHHTADAPTVDLRARAGGSTGAYGTPARGLSNPNRATLELPKGKYDVALSATGQNAIAFGPATLDLLPGRLYSVFAIGKLGQPSFRLFLQEQFLKRRTSPAQVSVIHGIPGLPANVEVWANNSRLFAFGYGEVRGPLQLAPDTYKIDVRLNGNTVLTASPKLDAGVNYSAIAHLDTSGMPKLSFFVNNVKAAMTGNARVTVRHTAQAIAVDVRGRPANTGNFAVLAGNLSNSNEASLELGAGSYDVGLSATGNTRLAFGPTTLSLSARKLYTVYAVGVLGQSSFRLVLQSFDLRKALATQISGQGCGGARIAISKSAIDFDESFMVSASGLPRHAFCFLHVGASDSQFGSIKLPFDLGVLGLRGCTLYQDSIVIFPTTANGSGSASFELTVPSTLPDLAGAYLQWSYVVPSGIGGLSDLLSITGN